MRSDEGSLDIYNSQYNIAHEIYQRWQARGMFSDREMFDALNFVFVGPSPKDLRNQTIDDLVLLAKEINLFGEMNVLTGEEYAADELRSLAKTMVFNSNGLKGKKIVDGEDGEYDDDSEDENVGVPNIDVLLKHIAFFKSLEEDVACERLHLIIHDEAHWGIKVGSLLDKFFHRLLDIMNSMNTKPKLLVLLVSATSDVIQIPVRQFHDNNFVVDWNSLASSGSSAFVAPSYRSIYNLEFVNDCTHGSQLHAKDDDNKQIRLTTRSTIIVESYTKAARVLSEQIATHNFPRPAPADDLSQIALCELLQVDDLIELRSYQKGAKRNKIVFVRVFRIDDAGDLANRVKESFGECPFEIIQLTSQAPPLHEQLSERGREYLCGNTARTIKRVNDLQDIPVLIVTVQKMAMGERMPSSCSVFDIRVPYKGSWDCVTSGSNTKFVQDVGRCAGHKINSPRTKILLALEKDEDEESHTSANSPTFRGSIPSATSTSPIFRTTHPLLTDALNKPKKRVHTEHKDESRLYSNMACYSVLLNASPQIGKTGAFLSLIEILFANHISGAVVKSPVDLDPLVSVRNEEKGSGSQDDFVDRILASVARS
jgi:hypothetical protein